MNTQFVSSCYYVMACLWCSFGVIVEVNVDVGAKTEIKCTWLWGVARKRYICCILILYFWGYTGIFWQQFLYMVSCCCECRRQLPSARLMYACIGPYPLKTSVACAFHYELLINSRSIEPSGSSGTEGMVGFISFNATFFAHIANWLSIVCSYQLVQ